MLILADNLKIKPLLALFAGIGDLITTGVGTAGLLLLAKSAKLPLPRVAVVLFWQLLDLGIGSIPVVGDILDFFFKSYKLSENQFKKHAADVEKKARAAGLSDADIEIIMDEAKAIREERVELIGDSLIGFLKSKAFLKLLPLIMNQSSGGSADKAKK